MMEKRTKQVKWNSKSIHSLRGHMEMTQQEMALELGIRQQTVSDWETGMYEPRGTSNTLLNIIAERTGFIYETGKDKG